MKAIRIAGAGVSGLTAAITLANGGVPVEVHEILPFHTWRSVSKGIQAIRNYEARQDILDKFKGMGIRFSNPYPVYREVRYSPSLKQIEIFSKDRPIFYCLSRNPPNSITLDLFNEAVCKGGILKFGSTINNPDITAIGGRKRLISAFAYHYKETSSDGSVHIFLNNEYASQGYLCMLPYHDGEMTIESVSFNGNEDMVHLKRQVDRFIKVNKVAKGFLEDARKAYVVSGHGYYSASCTAKSGSSILTGEAAGFMDASRGFGLSYAVESGYLAAKSLLENCDYDELWKTSFGEKLFRYYLKRSQLTGLNNGDYEKIIDGMIREYGSRISIEKYSDYKKSRMVIQ